MASKFYINKLEQSAKLLLKQPIKILTTSKTKQKLLIKNSCPCKRPKKIVKEIINTILSFYIIISNILAFFILTASKSTAKQAISIIKASNKIYKPTIYNKTIKNLIYNRQ